MLSQQIKDHIILINSSKYEKFDRYELKYYILNSEIENILKYLSEFMLLDKFCTNFSDNYYSVNSLYFENHNYYCYRQKFDGLPERRKFRVRFYNDNPSQIYLEVKKKRNFFTEKDRIKIDSHNGILKKLIMDSNYLKKNVAVDHQQKSEFFYFLHLLSLKPFLWVSYNRLALTGKFNKGIRITFDRNVCGRKCDLHKFNKNTLTPVNLNLFSRKIIMEIKFRKIMPYWLETFIKEMNIGHRSISKYALVFENTIGEI